MLELLPGTSSVAVCVAEATACDTVEVAATRGDARVLRVAPDEVLAVGDPAATTDLLASIAAAAAADPDGIVLDATDGWTEWILRGDVADALARLSHLPLPEQGIVQGDVARVPVKLFLEPDEVRLFVPAMWGEYLRGRILERCRGLGVVEVGR